MEWEGGSSRERNGRTRPICHVHDIRTTPRGSSHCPVSSAGEAGTGRLCRANPRDAISGLAALPVPKRRVQELDERLFRGREAYRGDTSTSPAISDVERLYDIIVELHKPRNVTPGVRFGTGWWLQRATSKRPGEAGELFIVPLGVDDEVRIASRDGNLPFIMRLKARPFEHEFSCIVWCMKDALMHILAATDAVRLPYVDGHRPRPDEARLRGIWRDVGVKDSALDQLASVLFARDDRRRLEDNPSGTRIK